MFKNGGNSSRRSAAGHPDRDPRLAEARRLMDEGDPLGEFIMVQCELDRLRCLQPRMSLEKLLRAEARQRELRDWEEQLLKAHGDEWAAPLHVAGVDDVAYRRGFPDELFMEAPVLAKNAEEIFRLAPTTAAISLKYLRAEPCPPHLAQAIATTAQLAQIERLALTGSWGDVAVEELARSTHLNNVRVIHLAGTGVGPDSFRALLASQHLQSLEELDLSGNVIGTRGAALIMPLQGKRAALRWLGLSDACFDDEAASFLGRSPVLIGLATLSLEANSLTDEGVKHLIDSQYLIRSIIYVDINNLSGKYRDILASRLRARGGRRSGRR